MLGHNGHHGAADHLWHDHNLHTGLASEIVFPADLLAQVCHLHGLSQMLSDAAAEFQCRFEMGEFDDLDDMQLGDLHMLGQQMAQWAGAAQLIEQRLSVPLLSGPGEAAAQ